MNGSSYRQAGVDVDAAAGLVEALKAITRATARPGAAAEIGGFAGTFDPRAAGFRDPVLVASTDGVGTKLKVAVAADGHDTIGIDLVAMCVNDVVVQGAEPLFFLDYFATGRLDPGIAERVVRGIAAGCREAGCALIGGETAEMPGVYAEGDYDLAGFAVGAAERGTLITGEAIAEGDAVLGLASAGLHSNGFSLVRRIVAEAGLDYLGPAPFAEGTLAAALLAPTRIYVAAALAAHRAGLVKGYAHITGGGLTDNIARILPAGLSVALDAGCWPLPPVFRWLAAAGGIAPGELARTFNCGLGLIAVVAPEAAEPTRAVLAAHGEAAIQVGAVVARKPEAPAVALSGHDPSWRG